VTQWDNFFHQIAPLASRLPYMTAPGNHERDWPGSGDKWVGPPPARCSCALALVGRRWAAGSQRPAALGTASSMVTGGVAEHRRPFMPSPPPPAGSTTATTLAGSVALRTSAC
jgi:hypothetical protein